MMCRDRTGHIHIIGDQRDLHSATFKLRRAIEFLWRLRRSDENVPEAVIGEILGFRQCRHRYSTGFSGGRNSRDLRRLRCLEMGTKSDTVAANGVAHSLQV